MCNGYVKSFPCFVADSTGGMNGISRMVVTSGHCSIVASFPSSLRAPLRAMESRSTSSSATPTLPSNIVQSAITASKGVTGVEAFLARTEISKLSRALKARLSYASYKATHNLSHVPLQTLEDSQLTTASSRQTLHESSQTSLRTRRESASSSGARSPRRRSLSNNSISMPPPPAPTSLYSALLGGADTDSSHNTRSAKRARHMQTGSTASTSSAVSTKPSTRASRASSRRRRARATSPGGRSIGSTTSVPTDGGDVDMVDATTEIEDMTAAAALTSMLHQSTGGSSGGMPSVPHSPAPSHASSFDHEGLPRAPISSSRERGRHSRYPSNASDSAMLSPPLFAVGQAKSSSTTPKGPSDADAAELMLFLATSPSPARPSVSSRPPGAAAKAGRVLFPVTSNEEAESGSKSLLPAPPINLSSTSLNNNNPEQIAPPMNNDQQEVISTAALLPPPPSPTRFSGSQETRVDTCEEDATGGSQSTLYDGVSTGETEKLNSGLPSPLSTSYRGSRASFPYGMETPGIAPPPNFTQPIPSSNSDCAPSTHFLYPDPDMPQSGLVESHMSFSEYFSVSPASSTWAMTPNAHTFPRTTGQGGAAAAVGRRLFQDEEEPSAPSSEGQGSQGQMALLFPSRPANKGGTGKNDGQHHGADLVGVGSNF
ncbi:uncharacterized protein EI90DRAFT_2065864 [Cantharellus anzutake]|uniref:uncharacterized protein n=1 Tax=Cantharellus anzutake TaxID=1750568 RepID=UPI0019033DC5|nr:uncharacterized protein EI90DRAFT_2065864 [Cantharellus anzutake]KAF8340459.1 hypothetical protein EI90DRAFT_2065864 [Cantharellus anzutake]